MAFYVHVNELFKCLQRKNKRLLSNYMHTS